MRIPILMPQLGESIAEATLLRLDVAVGIRSGDQEIMEVETQKATMGVTIPCGGEVEELTCTVGESYPVGTILGYLIATRRRSCPCRGHARSPRRQPGSRSVPAKTGG